MKHWPTLLAVLVALPLTFACEQEEGVEPKGSGEALQEEPAASATATTDAEPQAGAEAAPEAGAEAAPEAGEAEAAPAAEPAAEPETGAAAPAPTTDRTAQRTPTQPRQPAAEQPVAEEPATEQAAAEQPAAEEPAAERPASEQAAAEPPPAEPAAPAGASAAMVAQGKEVWDRSCKGCHGADGSRTKFGKWAMQDLTDAAWQNKVTDAQLTKVTVEGMGEPSATGRLPMPAFGEKLSGAQVKAVVAFMRTLDD